MTRTAKRDADETPPVVNRAAIAKAAWLARAKAEEAGLAARYVETAWPTPLAPSELRRMMRHCLPNRTGMTCTAKRDANETLPAVNRAANAKAAWLAPGMSRPPGRCRRPLRNCAAR